MNAATAAIIEPRTTLLQSTPLAQSPQVHIACFGGFRIYLDGREIDLSSIRPRVRALLRLMAHSAGRYVHRELLIDALWQDADVRAGIRSLQVALSSIRQLFRQEGFGDENSIVRNDCAYKLALSAGSTVDVRTFEEQVREAARRKEWGDLPKSIEMRRAALGLYQGELLPEDGPADHITAERERLRMLAATTAAALAEDHRQMGDDREALTAAWLSVRIDPHQDPPWRLIVRLSESIGDTSAAQVARRRHALARAALGL